jgi:hypothetical protein
VGLLLVVLVVVAIVLIYNLVGTDPGPPVQPVSEPDIDRQIQGLRDLIEENVERPGGQ